MNAVLHAPWIILLVITPLAGALLLRLRSLHHMVRRIGLWTATVTLGLTAGMVVETAGWSTEAILVDPLDPLRLIGLPPLWSLDRLSMILLPYAALIGWVVILLTPRAERGTASLGRTLVSLTCLLALFASRTPGAILFFYLAGLLPPIWPNSRQDTDHVSCSQAFRIYTLSSGVLLMVGVLCQSWSTSTSMLSFASGMVLLAVMTRKGLVPLHAWLPAFFQQGSFRLVLMYSMPQAGIYIAVRLLLPHGSDGWLGILVIAALATALYTAGLAMVQDEARRMFGYFFMSQSALVLAGIQSQHFLGLVAALTLWLSAGLSLTGLGLTIWALEARRGPLSLGRYHGGYEQTPTLAACFVILGLTSVGFPGTLGFVGQEMLVDSALETHSLGSVAIMSAIVLNGITLLRAYFLLFCGASCDTTATQRMRLREKVGVLCLALALVAGGLYPEPIARSTAAAARQLLADRPISRVTIRSTRIEHTRKYSNGVVQSAGALQND